MKSLSYKHSLLIFALFVIQASFLNSCNTKSNESKRQVAKIGFLSFYLDMDYLKVKSTMDSLLNINQIHYFETTDVLGNKQKNLYYDFSGVSKGLWAKVNLTGSLIIDERLTSIQLTLCNRSNTDEQQFSYNCDFNTLNRLFESYKEKYGKPAILGQGEKYDWLSKRISNIYFTGPQGRWIKDKIYYWERGNYIIYFDFGYPESLTNSGNANKEPNVPGVTDSTSAPIIFYDFTPDYIDKLLEKASRNLIK